MKTTLKLVAVLLAVLSGLIPGVSAMYRTRFFRYNKNTTFCADADLMSAGEDWVNGDGDCHSWNEPYVAFRYWWVHYFRYTKDHQTDLPYCNLTLFEATNCKLQGKQLLWDNAAQVWNENQCINLPHQARSARMLCNTTKGFDDEQAPVFKDFKSNSKKPKKKPGPIQTDLPKSGNIAQEVKPKSKKPEERPGPVEMDLPKAGNIAQEVKPKAKKSKARPGPIQTDLP